MADTTAGTRPASATDWGAIIEEQNRLLHAYWGAGEQGWPAELRWLAELRLASLDRFSHLSWPSPQEEEWRRTDVTGIDFGRYRQVRACALDLEPARAALERTRGVALLGLEQAVRQHPQRLRPLLEEEAAAGDNRFQAWHYGLLGGGLFLYVPPFVEVPQPLEVELVLESGGELSAPHVVLVLDTAARATVVVRLRQQGAGPALVNAATSVRLAEGAALSLVQAQELGPEALCFHHARARLQRDARLLSVEGTLGSRLVKTRLDCALEGPGAEALLKGLYLCGGGQHMDIRTVQRHRSPRATSRAFYKGAVQGGGRSVFQGLIEVSPGASKTDAYLSNKNLILDSGGRADSIPSLRIDNDDVRCSHGSTTGRIDEDQLFYLQSRGLDRAEARRALIEAYFEELLGELEPGPAAAHLRRGLLDRLREAQTEA